MKEKSDKNPAKKVATTKKSGAKKVVAKKAVAKKATAKKATAQKTATKKVATKKSAAKKTTEKKNKFVEKILVAIDDTGASLKAINYLARLGEVLNSCEVTLYHGQPSIPPDMLEDGGSDDPEIIRALNDERDEEIGKWEGEQKAFTKRIFDGAKKELIDGGILPANIKTRISFRSTDIGKDIVDYAQKGGYTTIVVGRRRLSFLQELALGSVSYRVVKLAKNCSVWVVE